ncbi:MAG: DUF4349 domain-containing protein [Oscillospiraceae bacterium]|nr:DUF4349 domain-containing protein [Oscillospiraceae bacterium]
MKKCYLLFIIFILCVYGCSSSAGYDNSVTWGAFETSGNYMDDADSLYSSLDTLDSNGFESTRALRTSAAYGNTAPAQQTAAQRKIIRDANLNIEVADVEDSYNNMLESLEDYGGYEANKTLEVWGEHMYISAELKVPAESLDAFLRAITREGEVRSQNIFSSDITDQYYDSATRLATLELTLAKYLEFLENAENVEEQLSVSGYISDLTYQIESLKGSLNRWDFLTAYSNVSVYIHKTPETIEELRVIEWSSLSFEDMGYLIKSGFVLVSSFIVNMFQRIFIALIAGSPVIIPAGIVTFILIRRSRKKRREKDSLKSVSPDTPEDTP